VNIEEVAYAFYSQILSPEVDPDPTGVEFEFHEWCEAQQIPADKRNTVWREVALALGIDPPS